MPLCIRAPPLQVGLPRLNAPEAYVSPYGIAINKQAAGSELEQRLVYALTGWVRRWTGRACLGCTQDSQ